MARRAVILMLVASVVLAAGAVLLLSPRSVGDLLSAPEVDQLGNVGVAPSTLGPAERTGDDPADFLIDAPEGLLADGPIAALSGNQPVFISDVITGYSTRVAEDVPAEITTIRPIMGCLLTPPLPGTAVGNVVAGQSDLVLGLLTYDDSDLAAAVQAFVDAYRQAGQAEASANERLAYQSYDVVVTETAAPVYLVLQSGDGNRIWNIHAAPGARIERVVLLGGHQAGVANLDPVVPVEVILADGLQACGIRPAHALNAGHSMNQAAQAGSPEAIRALADQTATVAAYDLWFRDTFGILSGPTRAGFDRGTVSVVGPVPGKEDPPITAKAAYVPVAGAKIRTTEDAFFEILGQVPDDEDFASRVRAIATSFAFGDLANLRQGADF